MSGAGDRLEDRLAELERETGRLRAETRRLKGIIGQARDIIVTTDIEGRITEFNEEAEKVLGYREAEVLGRPAELFYADPSQRTALLAELEADPDGAVRADVEVRTKSGERRWLGISLCWQVDEDGRRVGTIGVSKDITTRRRLEAELRRLSITDKLTGLYNQSHFFHRLEVEKERAVRLGHDVSLLLFDLDGFKELNDALGHRRGDEALKQIGTILFQSVRREVDSAFRYGGDEFTVLLPGADLKAAVGFGERVRKRIEAEDLDGIRASMGVCAFDPADPARQLVEKADEAMYLAKRSGGNCIAAYDPARDDAVLWPRPESAERRPLPPA